MEGASDADIGEDAEELRGACVERLCNVHDGVTFPAFAHSPT